jgi:hypothetical protein
MKVVRMVVDSCETEVASFISRFTRSFIRPLVSYLIRPDRNYMTFKALRLSDKSESHVCCR